MMVSLTGGRGGPLLITSICDVQRPGALPSLSCGILNVYGRKTDLICRSTPKPPSGSYSGSNYILIPSPAPILPQAFWFLSNRRLDDGPLGASLLTIQLQHINPTVEVVEDSRPRSLISNLRTISPTVDAYTRIFRGCPNLDFPPPPLQQSTQWRWSLLSHLLPTAHSTLDIIGRLRRPPWTSQSAHCPPSLTCWALPTQALWRAKHHSDRSITLPDFMSRLRVARPLDTGRYHPHRPCPQMPRLTSVDPHQTSLAASLTLLPATITRQAP